jgi:preprotein translocase subunit SecG
MKIALLILEFIISIGLITTVLMHYAKGEGLGAIGGSARMFNVQKGLESGLDKLTAALAASFLVLAIILSILFS